MQLLLVDRGSDVLGRDEFAAKVAQRVRQGPKGNSLAPVVVAGQDRPMGAEVLWTDNPRRALETKGRFLAGDPVRHNLILTLLHRGVAHPEPARYWTVLLDGQPAGLVLQSPLDFVATLTPMPDEAVAAVVQSIVDAGVVLPGVNGEAAVAARFAGQWTESNRSSAWPVQGRRIYEVRRVETPYAEGTTSSARSSSPHCCGVTATPSPEGHHHGDDWVTFRTRSGTG
jgi:hypothetical protein